MAFMADIIFSMFEPAIAEKLLQSAAARGHTAAAAASLAATRDLLAARAADLLFFNYLPQDEAQLVFVRQFAHSPSSGKIKIMAATPDGSLGKMELLFQCGVDECVPRPFRLGDLLDKIDKLLVRPEDATAENVHVDATEFNSVPKALHERVAAIRETARELGDVAEVFTGVTVSDSKGRRLSPPSGDWQMVLTERSVEPFYENDEREFYLFRRAMVNRIPEKNEYFVAEKVVVCRTAAPLAATLDMTRLPFSNGLFGIITVRGLEPGYLACVLNSRFANFYLQRYRAANDGMHSAYLTRFDLEAFPIIIADPDDQAHLAALARQVCVINPKTRNRDKLLERGKLLDEINRQVFAVFGFTKEEVKLLAGLHY